MKVFKDKKTMREYKKELVSKKKEENVILAKGLMLGTDTQKTRRNINTFVVGTENSDMNENFVLPNILQGNTSFVVTDPCGEILHSSERFLKESGYKIKILDLIDIKKSNKYNPFFYARDEKDIALIVSSLPKNPNKKEEPYDKYENVLLEALCLYVFETFLPENQNFATVSNLLFQLGQKDENGEFLFKNLFEIYKEDAPEAPSVKRYELLMEEAKDYLYMLFVACSIRLAAFNLTTVAEFTSDDDFDLKSIGYEKTAVFCVVPGTASSFSAFVNLLYTQAFDALLRSVDETQDELKNPDLPYNVRLFLDTNEKFGVVPEFEKKIAIARPYGVSFTVLVRNFEKLKELYPSTTAYPTVTVLEGNCDSVVLYGPQSAEVIEYFTKKLGEEKVMLASSRFTLDWLDENHCVCFVRGYGAFYRKKYNIRRHPNYWGV